MSNQDHAVAIQELEWANWRLVPDEHAAALRAYIVDLVGATRREGDLALGASPRGALALQRAAQSYAAGVGRDYVTPDDVKTLAPAVLTHRLLVAPEAELRGVTAEDIVERVLGSVAVPRAGG